MSSAGRCLVVLSFIVLGFALFAPAHAVAAQTRTLTTTNGDVTATLTWLEPEASDTSFESDIDVEVVRGALPGSTVSITPAGCDLVYCFPFPFGSRPELKTSELHVRNLDLDADLEVVVYVAVEAWAPASRFVVIDRHEGSERVLVRTHDGYGVFLRDVDRDGRAELGVPDGRFARRFGEVFAPALPLQLLALRSGRFRDVSRMPAAAGLLANDATMMWAKARSGCASASTNTYQPYSAWAHDMYRLGRRARALALLHAQRRQGCLHGPSMTPVRYIRSLDAWLLALGRVYLAQ